MTDVTLQELTDAHFAWMLGEAPAPAGSAPIVEGGVAPPEIIALLRGVAISARGDDDGRAVAWVAVVDGEACAMISYKTWVDASGAIDIGYGTAPPCRGRGIASAMVGALVEKARGDGHIALTAETATDNFISQNVLLRNGFVRNGERTDPEDGPLYMWRLTL